MVCEWIVPLQIRKTDYCTENPFHRYDYRYI